MVNTHGVLLLPYIGNDWNHEIYYDFPSILDFFWIIVGEWQPVTEKSSRCQANAQAQIDLPMIWANRCLVESLWWH